MGKTIVQSSRDLLWTNPSPTSGFSAQTLNNINWSPYSYIDVETTYNATDGNNNDKMVSRIPTTKSTILAKQGYGNGAGCRRVTFGNNSITFSAGRLYYGTTDIEDNNTCVPLKIYGIK